MQALGKDNMARWTVALLQGHVWRERTASTRTSQMRKFIKFVEERGREMQPGEIELVVYID